MATGDPWQAFGSDDDDDDDNEEEVTTTCAVAKRQSLAKNVIPHLVHHCRHHNPHIALHDRRIGCYYNYCHHHHNTNSHHRCCMDDNHKGNENDSHALLLQSVKDEWNQCLYTHGLRNIVELPYVSSSSTTAGTDMDISTSIQSLPMILDAIIIVTVCCHHPIDNNNNNKQNSTQSDASLWAHLQSFVLPAGCLIWCMEDNSSINSTTTATGSTVMPWSTTTNNNNNNNKSSNNDTSFLDVLEWKILHTHIQDPSIPTISPYIVAQKFPCPIQRTSCPWLSRTLTQNVKEVQRLAEATIVPSVYEITQQHHHHYHNNLNQPFLTRHARQQAVHALQTYGYAIVRQCVDCATALAYGQAALQDVHAAAVRLQHRDGIDLYHPLDSQREPTNYRELSMREDLRMDVRAGPALHALRGTAHGPMVLPSNTTWHSDFLRGHADLLWIVRAVMYPTPDPLLSSGNLGRYNFGGRGPDGSCPDMCASVVGAIVSLPGAADQAIHADTPHLFEHVACLPAHYINLFTPGVSPHPSVGQTALVHTSHRLDVASRYTAQGWHADVVRPYLDVGDVLLMDCRTWHFGQANTTTARNDTTAIERPLLYTNMTLHWFHDPKNWQTHQRIFPELDGATSENHGDDVES
jgi:hypothetical protein